MLHMNCAPLIRGLSSPGSPEMTMSYFVGIGYVGLMIGPCDGCFYSSWLPFLLIVVILERNLNLLTSAWVHLVDNIRELVVCLAIVARLEVVDLALRVDNKDFMKLNSNCSVAESVRIAIAKAGIERVRIRWEEVFDCLKTSNLKHLGLLLNHFAIEWLHEPVRTHHDGSLWQCVLALAQTGNVVTGWVCLPNSSSR